MTTQTSATTGTARLATIRRLYFYLVALISLIAGLAGLASLFDNLSEAWLGETGGRAVYDQAFLREMIARDGGLLLVATPIFLLHWGYMQRRRHEPGETGAALRKFFLYVATAVAVGYALVAGHSLLIGITQLALGEPPEQSAIWPSDWLHQLLTLLCALALQFYLYTVLVGDGDYGHESGVAGVWRRFYQFVAGLVGLCMTIWGGASVLETGWRLLFDRFTPSLIVGVGWWRGPLSDGVALALLGAILVRINWRRWRAITEWTPGEATTALRRLYLYSAVVISALVALTPAAVLLRELLLLVFGAPYTSWTALADQLVTPLAFAPLGVVAWVWHWRFLRAEAERYGESSEGATVRRLYYYTVAATGLVLLWFGSTSLLQAVLDRVLVTDGNFWIEPLATGLSLLAAGAPIWALHWRAAQASARQPTAAGARERSSLPRRVYLYGVALAGALLILFYLALVVYRLLLLLLGDPNAGLFSAATVSDLARSIIAAVLWAVHVMAIRDDAQMPAADADTKPETPGEQREALLQRIHTLETELATARAALADLERVTG